MIKNSKIGIKGQGYNGGMVQWFNGTTAQRHNGAKAQR